MQRWRLWLVAVPPARLRGRPCLSFLIPPTTQVLGIRACLSDPSLAKFDVQQCGGLLRMLDAVNLGNTNPAVSCELACVQQFAKVCGRACAKHRVIAGQRVQAQGDRMEGRAGRCSLIPHPLHIPSHCTSFASSLHIPALKPGLPA